MSKLLDDMARAIFQREFPGCELSDWEEKDQQNYYADARAATAVIAGWLRSEEVVSYLRSCGARHSLRDDLRALASHIEAQK